MSRTYKIAFLFLLGAMAATLFLLVQKPWQVGASTTVGNDYSATSTKNFVGTALTNLTAIKSIAGTVARLTITGANTGVVRLWDATTTDVTKRAGATTTLSFIEIPASTVANTYDFDMEFRSGIIYELVSGTAPTSTLIWR